MNRKQSVPPGHRTKSLFFNIQRSFTSQKGKIKSKIWLRIWKESSRTHAHTQKDTQEIYQYFLSVGSTHSEMRIKFLRHHILIVASQVVLVVKNLPSDAIDVRDPGLIPGSGRSPRGGHGNPLQYSCLENLTDRGTWWAMVPRVSKSQDTTEAT